MSTPVTRDALGWGFGLWLVGYVLGIVLFAVVPVSLVGWAIMPIGVALTVWVAFVKVQGDAFQHYVIVAVAWTLIAIACDYLFLVQLFKPADGYYKLDVYLYYLLTAAIPLAAGWRRTRALARPRRA